MVEPTVGASSAHWAWDLSRHGSAQLPQVPYYGVPEEEDPFVTKTLLLGQGPYLSVLLLYFSILGLQMHHFI